jgi:hypothetical protein
MNERGGEGRGGKRLFFPFIGFPVWKDKDLVFLYGVIWKDSHCWTKMRVLWLVPKISVLFSARLTINSNLQY